MNRIHVSRYFARSLPEIRERLSYIHFHIGSEHLINVTHINDPHSFYVRIASLCHSLPLLEQPGPPITFTHLETGKIAVYMSKTLEKYVRGCITKLTFGSSGREIHCTMFAMDYGFYDNRVYLQDVFLPNDAAKQCEGLAVHCKLDMCEPRGIKFDEEAIHAMKYFVGPNTSKITIVKRDVSGKFIVDLKCFEEYNYDTAHILAKHKFTKARKTLGEQTEYVPNPLRYQPKKLNVGDILRVVVLSGIHIDSFYVFETKDIKHYYDFERWINFNIHCITHPTFVYPGTVLGGRACGVKMQNPLRYEGACVKGISKVDKKALVQLVDWGRHVEVNTYDIIPVEKEFIRRPLALYCTAARNQDVIYGPGGTWMYNGIELGIEILQVGIGLDVPHKVKLHPVSIFNNTNE